MRANRRTHTRWYAAETGRVQSANGTPTQHLRHHRAGDDGAQLQPHRRGRTPRGPRACGVRRATVLGVGSCCMAPSRPPGAATAPTWRWPRGCSGCGPDDPSIADAMRDAADQGLPCASTDGDLGEVHPNTVEFGWPTRTAGRCIVRGSSLGGGDVVVTDIDDFAVQVSGELPLTRGRATRITPARLPALQAASPRAESTSRRCRSPESGGERAP